MPRSSTSYSCWCVSHVSCPPFPPLSLFVCPSVGVGEEQSSVQVHRWSCSERTLSQTAAAAAAASTSLSALLCSLPPSLPLSRSPFAEAHSLTRDPALPSLSCFTEDRSHPTELTLPPGFSFCSLVTMHLLLPSLTLSFSPLRTLTSGRREAPLSDLNQTILCSIDQLSHYHFSSRLSSHPAFLFSARIPGSQCCHRQ